jgi:protease IV
MAKMSFSNLITTFFLVLIAINILPSMLKNIQKQYADLLKPKVKVGKIKIKDAIVDTTEYRKYIKEYFEDTTIKALMLDIESPGGAAGSSQAIFNEILKLKEEHKKPIVALTHNLCASGAYYIATATDYIVAPPSALIGSIGSFIGLFKLNDLIEKLHTRYEIEQSGDYKTATNAFTPSTPEQKAMLKQLSDDVYEQFTHDVATRRNLDLTKASLWANGRIFTGNAAHKLGLIDEIGSEYNMTKKLQELLQTDREIEWVSPPAKTVFEKMLEASMSSLSMHIKNTITSFFGTPSHNTTLQM